MLMMSWLPIESSNRRWSPRLVHKMHLVLHHLLLKWMVISRNPHIQMSKLSRGHERFRTLNDNPYREVTRMMNILRPQWREIGKAQGLLFKLRRYGIKNNIWLVLSIDTDAIKLIVWHYFCCFALGIWRLNEFIIYFMVTE